MTEWVEENISVLTKAGKEKINAFCYGTIAVHKLIPSPDDLEAEENNGYTITYIPNGMRISAGGRVFKNLETAKVMAVSMYDYSTNWDDFFDNFNFVSVSRNLFSIFLREKYHNINESEFYPVAVMPSR